MTPRLLAAAVLGGPRPCARDARADRRAAHASSGIARCRGPRRPEPLRRRPRLAQAVRRARVRVRRQLRRVRRVAGPHLHRAARRVPAARRRFRPSSRASPARSRSTCSALADRRVWQNCLYTLDRNGKVKERWTQWDKLCEGSDGPGPHRLRISPYDPERRVWVDQRDVPPDLRVLERRQQAAEDARREERSRQRRHALRQAAGRGVPARRPDPHRRRPRQPPRDDPRPAT